MPEPRFLLLSDVAAELNVSDSQVYHLVRSGELPAIKIGGRGQWRVERARLEEYIQRKYEEALKELQEAVRVYQSHSESLVLSAHANQNLQKAGASKDYQLFARSLYGFQEALALWDQNHRARLLLTETQRDYSTCALENGDLVVVNGNWGSSVQEVVMPRSSVVGGYGIGAFVSAVPR